MKRLARAWSLAAAACGADPASVFDRQGPESVFARDAGVPDAPDFFGGGKGGSRPTTRAPGMPQIDPVPPTWSYQTIPIKGRVPGVTPEEDPPLLLITGGADVGGLTERVRPGSGAFCVDVRLRPNQENRLSISAQNTMGDLSPPALVTVHHHAGTEPGEFPEEPQGPQNLSLRAHYAAADPPPEEGGYVEPIDGDPGTNTKFGVSDWEFSSDCNNYAWYAVGFETTEVLERIVIRWTSPHAAQYRVALSNLAEPVAPRTDSSDWTFVRTFGCGETAGDGGTDEIALGNPTDIHWVAVVMYENAEGPNVHESFRIAELELWGPEPPAIAPPMAPTCDNTP